VTDSASLEVSQLVKDKESISEAALAEKAQPPLMLAARMCVRLRPEARTGAASDATPNVEAADVVEVHPQLFRPLFEREGAATWRLGHQRILHE